MLLLRGGLRDALEGVGAHQRRCGNTGAAIAAPECEMLFKKVGTHVTLWISFRFDIVGGSMPFFARNTFLRLLQ